MAEELRPAVYSLHEQANDQLMIGASAIVVRATVEPASIVSAVREAIWSIDPDWQEVLRDILESDRSHTMYTLRNGQNVMAIDLRCTAGCDGE